MIDERSLDWSDNWAGDGRNSVTVLHIQLRAYCHRSETSRRRQQPFARINIDDGRRPTTFDTPARKTPHKAAFANGLRADDQDSWPSIVGTMSQVTRRLKHAMHIQPFDGILGLESSVFTLRVTRDLELTAVPSEDDSFGPGEAVALVQREFHAEDLGVTAEEPDVVLLVKIHLEAPFRARAQLLGSR